MRLLQYCSTIRRTIYQQKNEKPFKKLRGSTKVKIKKADKGNTTVMNTQRKITEGKDQVYDSHKL